MSAADISDILHVANALDALAVEVYDTTLILPRGFCSRHDDVLVSGLRRRAAQLRAAAERHGRRDAGHGIAADAVAVGAGGAALDGAPHSRHDGVETVPGAFHAPQLSTVTP